MNKKIPKNINNIINAFLSRVNDILSDRIDKIILYGSYARGDYNNGSDIDIMILTNLSDDEIVEYRTKIYDIAYDIEFENDFDICISPLLKNTEKFDYWVDALPFYTNVKNEGVVLIDKKVPNDITIKSKKDLREKLEKGINDIKANRVYSLEETFSKLDNI